MDYDYLGQQVDQMQSIGAPVKSGGAVKSQLLRIREVAAMFAVCIKTVERMVARRELVVVRIAKGGVRIPFADVERYIRSRTS